MDGTMHRERGLQTQQTLDLISLSALASKCFCFLGARAGLGLAWRGCGM